MSPESSFHSVGCWFNLDFICLYFLFILFCCCVKFSVYTVAEEKKYGFSHFMVYQFRESCDGIVCRKEEQVLRKLFFKVTYKVVLQVFFFYF